MDRKSRNDPPPPAQDFDASPTLERSSLSPIAESTDDSLASGSLPRPATPLLVDAYALSKLLSVSLRTVRKLNATARLPRPVELGRRRLWSVNEIQAWLDMGAPSRATWESKRKGR